MGLPFEADVCDMVVGKLISVLYSMMQKPQMGDRRMSLAIVLPHLPDPNSDRFRAALHNETQCFELRAAKNNFHANNFQLDINGARGTPHLPQEKSKKQQFK